jgi:hypothetical protein
MNQLTKMSQGTDNKVITQLVIVLSKHFCYFKYFNLHPYTLAPLHVCVQIYFKMQCRELS